MTLIACTHLNTHPTMLGDVVISSPTKMHFEVPVAPYDISDKLMAVDGLWPNGFMQKIYVVSPTTTLGFAGYVHEMKNFYYDFKLFVAYHAGKLTDEQIDQFLNNYDKSAFTKSSCLILNVTEHPDMTLRGRYFSVGIWKEGHTESLQDLFVIGSGSESFLRQVTSHTLQLDNFNPTDPNNALIQNGIMATEFLGWELMGMLTIKNLWGGAYEIATFLEGRFQKMDDMAFVISVAEYSPSNNEIPNPKVVVHTKYYGNILLITSIPVEEPQVTYTDSHVIITCKKHFMKYYPVLGFENPPFAKLDQSTINKSFSTNNVGISFILTRKNLRPVNPIAFEFGGPISVEFDYGKELRIILSKERLAMLRTYNIKRDSRVVSDEIL